MVTIKKLLKCLVLMALLIPFGGALPAQADNTTDYPAHAGTVPAAWNFDVVQDTYFSGQAASLGDVRKVVYYGNNAVVLVHDNENKPHLYLLTFSKGTYNYTGEMKVPAGGGTGEVNALNDIAFTATGTLVGVNSVNCTKSNNKGTLRFYSWNSIDVSTEAYLCKSTTALSSNLASCKMGTAMGISGAAVRSSATNDFSIMVAGEDSKGNIYFTEIPAKLSKWGTPSLDVDKAKLWDCRYSYGANSSYDKNLSDVHRFTTTKLGTRYSIYPAPQNLDNWVVEGPNHIPMVFAESGKQKDNVNMLDKQGDEDKDFPRSNSKYAPQVVPFRFGSAANQWYYTYPIFDDASNVSGLDFGQLGQYNSGYGSMRNGAQYPTVKKSGLGLDPAISTDYAYAWPAFYNNQLYLCVYLADENRLITYTPTVNTPVIKPDGGTYTKNQSVTITCAVSGATIYYTTDGTDPTTKSTKYSKAITATNGMTIKAIAVASGMSQSDVATATYVVSSSTAKTGDFVHGILNNGTFTATPYVAGENGSNGLWYYHFTKANGDYANGDYVICLGNFDSDQGGGRRFTNKKLIEYLVRKGVVYYSEDFRFNSNAKLKSPVKESDIVTTGTNKGYIGASKENNGWITVIPYRYINPASAQCLTTIDLSNYGYYTKRTNDPKTNTVSGKTYDLYNFNDSVKLAGLTTDVGIRYFANNIKVIDIDRSRMGSHSRITTSIYTDTDGKVTGTKGKQVQFYLYTTENNLSSDGKTDNHFDNALKLFPNVEKLNLEFNTFSTIDVSANTKLKFLNMDNNKLGTLDVTSNGALQALYVSHNFDFMKLNANRNENMRDVRIFDTMYGYDAKSTNPGHMVGDAFNKDVVAKFPNLEILYCYANYFDQLDVTSLPNLKSLWALKSMYNADRTNNKGLWLHRLDLRQNPELRELVVDFNHLPGLHVASTHLGEGYDVQTDYTHTRTVASNATRTAEQIAQGYGQTRVTMANNYRYIKADMAKWNGIGADGQHHWHYLYYLRIMTNKKGSDGKPDPVSASHQISQKKGWYTISNYSDYTADNKNQFTRTRTEVGNENEQTLPINYSEVPGGMTMGYFSTAADAWKVATFTDSKRNGEANTDIRSHKDGDTNLEQRSSSSIPADATPTEREGYKKLYGKIVVLKEYDIVSNAEPVGNPSTWTGTGGKAPEAVSYLWNISNDAAAPTQAAGAPRKVAVTNPSLYWQRFYFDVVYPDFNTIATGIDDITADDAAAKTVQGVTYYDLQGRASAQPFQGVNIVVTTYTDGSRQTAKQIIR